MAPTRTDCTIDASVRDASNVDMISENRFPIAFTTPGTMAKVQNVDTTTKHRWKLELKGIRVVCFTTLLRDAFEYIIY